MKPDPTLKTARQVAADILSNFQPGRTRIDTETLLAGTPEKQRATDLVSTTIRNLTALDHVITVFSGRPIERISPDLLAILRVATCELVYRPLAPDYSILSEAVQYAKSRTRRAAVKQGNFVNAILRQIQRHITDRQAPLDPAVIRSMLPQNPETGCRFDTNILPSFDTDPAAYLNTTFSLPLWLIQDWLNEFGPQQTRDICMASNRTPSLYIRPNTLRTTRDDLLRKMTEADIDCEPVPDCPLIRLASPHTIPTLPGFHEGLFSVQDLTATRAVTMLDPEPGWTILDPCAAPGTKTTQLAEATGDKACIIASDIDSERLKLVRQNANRLSLGSIRTVGHQDLNAEIARSGPVDAILLDVPCSNTGVLSKRIEARHRVTAKALTQLARTQLQLLETWAPALKPGGRLCYSTCSIHTTENRSVIDTFLERHNDFELIRDDRILPSVGPFDHDGAYIAILQRK